MNGSNAEEMERLRARNADLERFVHMVEHDLQAPVRAIASFTQLLDEECAGTLTGTAEEYLKFVREGAVRLQGLIRDVGSYGRVGRERKAYGPCDLGAMVDGIIDDAAGDIAAAGVVVTVGGLPVVDGCGPDLKQMFQQLIDNAIRYRRESDPVIRVFGSDKASHWQVSIEDNGIGIPEEFREQVFEVFRRLHTRGETEGNGVGLAIARRVAMGHGGTLSVESEVGRGAVFTVSLPKKHGLRTASTAA